MDPTQHTQPANPLFGVLWLKPVLVFQSQFVPSWLLFRPRPSPVHAHHNLERWNVDGLVDPYRGLLP